MRGYRFYNGDILPKDLTHEELMEVYEIFMAGMGELEEWITLSKNPIDHVDEKALPLLLEGGVLSTMGAFWRFIAKCEAKRYAASKVVTSNVPY